jgi:8-oxo-dGTP diphosphatase
MSEYKNPAATVSLIVIQHNNTIYLINRKCNPFKNYWALPGGFLNYGKETLEEAGVRELKEETGLVTTIYNLKLLCVNSDIDRDPRDHVIDHVYVVKFFVGLPKANDDAKNIRLFDINNLPDNLAFDHKYSINQYRKNI